MLQEWSHSISVTFAVPILDEFENCNTEVTCQFHGPSAGLMSANRQQQEGKDFKCSIVKTSGIPEIINDNDLQLKWSRTESLTGEMVELTAGV